MPLVTYPANPDAWSETLTPAEGRWLETAGMLELDIINHVVGHASIRTYSDVYNYYVACRLSLNDGKEFDGTKRNAKFKFIHALETTLNGNCSIILYDQNNNQASKDFGTSPDQAWHNKEFVLGAGAGWTIFGDFDWTHIKIIRIDCWQKPRQGGGFWIDSPHFSYEVTEGILRVESSPTGKTGQMTYLGETYPFTTPSEVTLGVGTQVVVSINPQDFAYWHDDNTNPVRTEIIEIRKTIKAFYIGAVPAKLTTLSLDEKGNSFPGQNAVQLIYAGIEQYLDVPFSYRLTKGTYTLVAVPPEDRTFSFWRKPDGSTTEEQYITIDLQEDTQIEVHWIKKRVGLPILAVLGLIIFIPVVAIVILSRRVKKNA